MTVRFDDLEDFDSAGTTPPAGVSVPRGIDEVKGAIHRETCPKCKGTGRYGGHSSHGQQCFKCGGSGKLEFKTTKEQRERNRESQRTRRENKQATNLEKFEAINPDIAEWWNRSDFSFAQSLKQAVTKYGDLTERQLASAVRCIEADKAHREKQQTRQQAVEQAVAVAPAVDVSAVAATLERGMAKGIRKPKLRLAGAKGAVFVFSRAWDGGKHPGGVYVNGPSNEYFGVIKSGKFLRAANCDDSAEQAILNVCENPEISAIAYGRQFGICSCCGRELSNQLSIQLGIGPICRDKFF